MASGLDVGRAVEGALATVAIGCAALLPACSDRSTPRRDTVRVVTLANAATPAAATRPAAVRSPVPTPEPVTAPAPAPRRAFVDPPLPPELRD